MNFAKWTTNYFSSWNKYNYYVSSMGYKYFSYIFLGGEWWNNIGVV